MSEAILPCRIKANLNLCHTFLLMVLNLQLDWYFTKTKESNIHWWKWELPTITHCYAYGVSVGQKKKTCKLKNYHFCKSFVWNRLESSNCMLLAVLSYLIFHYMFLDFYFYLQRQWNNSNFISSLLYLNGAETNCRIARNLGKVFCWWTVTVLLKFIFSASFKLCLFRYLLKNKVFSVMFFSLKETSEITLSYLCLLFTFRSRKPCYFDDC